MRDSLREIGQILAFPFIFFWAVLLGAWDLLSCHFPSRKSLDGNVILITGGGGGLGRLMAVKMARRFKDLTIVLWDLNEELLASAKKEVEEAGVKCLVYRVDVTNRELVYATAQKIKEEVGMVSVLVNNAGIVSGKPFFQASDAYALKTMEVNCLSHYWTVKAFVPDMLAANKGHLVTIASSAGLCAVKGLADYCASKAAAISFHENIRMEIVTQEKDGVDALLVNPYFIDTGMFHGVRSMHPVLPILKPDYVADSIIQAMVDRRTVLCLPRYIYMILGYFMMPTKARDFLTELLGVSENMAEFKQTRKHDCLGIKTEEKPVATANPQAGSAVETHIKQN